MTPGTQRALEGVRVNIRSGLQRDGDGLLTAATPSSNCTLPPYCWNIPLHIHNNTYRYAFVSPEGGPLPARAGCRRCNHSSLSPCCRVRTAKTRRSTSRRAHQPTPRGSQFPLFHMWACFCDLFFFPSSKIVPAPVSWPDGILQRRATDGAEPWDGRRFWHPEPSTTDGVIRTFAGSYGAATCTNSRYSYRQTDIIILLPTCMLVRVLVHMYTSVGYLLFIDF